MKSRNDNSQTPATTTTSKGKGKNYNKEIIKRKVKIFSSVFIFK